MIAGDLISGVAAVLACASAGVLVAARTRLAMALAFAGAGVFAGLAVIAAGLFDAGAVILAAGLLAALFALASGAALGEMLTLALRPAPLAIGAVALCTAALLLAWPNAPPAPALAPPSPAVVGGAARGLDLFIALVAFAAVGAGVVAITGFGERGLFGPDKDGAP
ncbi:MAG: hypothetical protein SGJ23_12055 [Alphaproteobacteria bacterium]|nr:hypothetical protein [Alphaproteobacteria bacterium]